MSEQTISVPENVQIIIRAHGDLNLQGWEKQEILAEGDSRRSVSVQNNGNVITITCSDDCDMTVPMTAKLVVEQVSGDAFLRGLQGGLVIQKVGGDLKIEQVGPVEILSTGGDCLVYSVAGPLNIQRIGGEVVGAKIQGPLSVSSAGGDIQLWLDAFEVSLNGRGDVDLAVGALTGQKVSVNASGDAVLYVPQQVNADLNLVCGGDIGISAAGIDEDVDHVYTGKLGNGGSRISVHAGGDIEVTSRAWDNDDLQDAVIELEEHWAERAEHRAERLEHRARHTHSENFMSGNASDFDAQELKARLDKKVAEKMRQAQSRIDAAMKRIEERNHGFSFAIPHIPPVPPIPPVRPASAADVNLNVPHSQTDPSEAFEASKVSEDERLMILKMLQEKRITAEEAEKLLEALEG